MGKKIIDLAERRQQLWSETPKPVQAPQPVRTSRIIHRDEPSMSIDENGVPGWARDIPPNEGEPTCRRPDKCSGCVTPIWRWRRTGEWVCMNCLIYQVKYNKESGLEVSLEACNASGVYKDEYLWYEE